MWFIFGVLLTAAVVTCTNEEASSYCNICDDHTLCKYKGVSESCGDSVDSGVTDEEKKLILNIHNQLRRTVAKGLEFRGNNGSQPHAANMLKMEWDDEIAKVAQRWADQCQFQHDACRHDHRFKVGQNIYWVWRFPVIQTVNWTAAITSWYDEVINFDKYIIPSYKFDLETGHYTQLVWHDSQYLGCSKRHYGPNKIYICNYGPTGNWLNEPIYSIGAPCSQCPSGMQCEDGLCASSIKNEVTSYTSVKDDSGATDNSNILSPPSIDAIDFYNNTDFNGTEPSPMMDTTEYPIYLNLIDGLDISDDAEIRDEIEDLKKRIRILADKIAFRKLRQTL